MDLAGALDLNPDDRALVAFVGAGGKKTAMGRLVETARERGLTVGYTTTTHTPPPAGLPLVLTGQDAPAAALPDPDATGSEALAFAAERVTDPDRAAEKVRGYDPAVLDDLFGTDRFDWLLVKADGARRREFKAPGKHEPAIPAAATHVVPVASIRAAGTPLDSETVHRPERVAAITGTALGEVVTAETVGTVLGSQAGGLKDVPTDATPIPMVNKADTPTLRDQAREAIRVALGESSRIERGIVTSFQSKYLRAPQKGVF